MPEAAAGGVKRRSKRARTIQKSLLSIFLSFEATQEVDGRQGSGGERRCSVALRMGLGADRQKAGDPMRR
jgi:hypothetical protein